MRFQVLSLFPEMIAQGCSYGVVGQAIKDGKIAVETINPRDYTSDVHRSVDDRPFGGGDGMVMLPEPLDAATKAATERAGPGARKIYLSARGKPFTDRVSRDLSEAKEVILLCGRYGGVDQRFLEVEGFEETTIGDYVLSGGELAALVLIDATSRHRPGVLGNSVSSFDESFSEGLLEHPQFTRPREWKGFEVPEVLLSGNHAKIREWRKHLAVLLTAQTRPELLSGLPAAEIDAALTAIPILSERELRASGLKDVEDIKRRLLNLSADRGTRT